MTKRNINIGILLLTLSIAIGIVILGIAKSNGLLAAADLGVNGRVDLSSVSRVVYLNDGKRANLTLGTVAFNELGLNGKADGLLDALPRHLLS